ncbi:hypothetical protein KUTeg_019274 [Tegillarca granosa]|uniref:Uncharacterized protein n=1 Tax=Tegillarca granosa TaxID=220873 RepID=A0ABQ9EI06_TEGGR|nr:hypothetical protein KUTeg_019274 [Tegillarca granosa]
MMSKHVASTKIKGFMMPVTLLCCVRNQIVVASVGLEEISSAWRKSLSGVMRAKVICTSYQQIFLGAKYWKEVLTSNLPNTSSTSQAANPENPEYHRHGHQPSAPHAYYILDMYSESSLACSPAMTYHIGMGDKPAKLLLRGDSEGQVVLWALPEVSERQMTLVRQESFDRLPALPPRYSTTLQNVWDSLYAGPSGIIDGLCDVEGHPLHITATIYIPSQGHLDRVVHGLTAEEILNNCDENAAPTDALINPNITLAQAFKRRNLATFKNLAQQKLQQPGPGIQQPGIMGMMRPDLIKPQAYPMYIQGIRTNTRDPDAHIIFFDTESLIDEYSTMSPGELEAKGFIGFIPEPPSDEAGSKVTEKVETGMMSSPVQGRQSPRHSPSQSRKSSGPVPVNSNLTMETAQLFMSCLHAWGLDPDLDKLCINKLGLLKPKCPISFGLISRSGHMSLMLPGWHKRVCKEEMASSPDPAAGKITLMQQARSASYHQLEDMNKPATLIAQRGSASCLADYTDSDNELEPSTHKSPSENKSQNRIAKESKALEEMKLFSTKARWQISRAVTTQHLLSLISTANTLMSMGHASFAMRRPSKRTKSKKFMSNHGLLVSETNDSSEGGSEDETDMLILQQSQIKQGWSLLAALHCVLLPEMVGSSQIQSPQLEMLARRWQDRCLEKADDEEEDEEDDPMMAGDSPVHKTSSTFESRRKQATAIVMLGVIGAEFGHEIEPITTHILEQLDLMTFGLPLSPVADACRTARHALSLIATARPPALIITMAKEVARFHAMEQATHSQHLQPHNSVLVRGRHEILRVIELLVEKMPNDVADHLVEMITAHSGPVIAVSVSSDGKYLATYSHADNKLKFWQTASSSLFGIGSQQTKCVKQIPTPPCQVTNLTNLLKLVRLVWIDNKTIIMLTVDGKEQKYTV